MRLQTKPNRWACYPTAWAMALDKPVEELIKDIGHDGGEITFPGYQDPVNRRGFHSQEMISIALQHGIAPVPIELYPVLAPNKSAKEYVSLQIKTGVTNLDYFDDAVITGIGVIEGITDKGHNHAVAFEKAAIFDPDNGCYPYEKLTSYGFHPMRLWRMYRV